MAELLFAGIFFAVSALLLRNLGWRGAPVFASVALIVIVSELTGRLGDFFAISNAAFVGATGEAIAKIIGIGYLFGISSDICRELGEGGIASGLVLAGKIEMIGVALPFLRELVDSALSVVGEI